MSVEQPADVVHTNVSAGLADHGHDLKAEAHVDFAARSRASGNHVRSGREIPINLTTDPTLIQRLPVKRCPDGIHVRRGERVELVLGDLGIVCDVESI